MSSNTTDSKPQKMGTFSLTMMSLSSLIGFGWLFGVYNAARMAGPASIFSWLLGGVAVMMIAFTLIELGAMFPKTGGIVHYLHISHGPLAGFIGGWVSWLVLSAIVAIEASASIQCLASWNFTWSNSLYNVKANVLTVNGQIFAMGLILIYYFLNFWSLKILVNCINILGILKLVIPILIAFILIVAGFISHSPDTAMRESFMPNGWNSVLSAIPACGIFLCYYGFHSVLSFSSEEVKDTTESLPVAIITSLSFCIILYILAQIAFIIALPPAEVIDKWKGLNFINSPFMKLAITMNLNFVLLLLNIETIISPNGSGLVSAASSFRMLNGMAQDGNIPKGIDKIHPKYKISRRAICINCIISFAFLLLVRNWKDIIAVISIGCIISYISGPVALGALRKAAPRLKRKVKLPFIKIVSPLAFIFCTLALYWANWQILGRAIIVLFLSVIIYVIIKYYKKIDLLKNHLKSCLWLIYYLLVMVIISYFGATEFGGKGYLPSRYDQLIVALIALIFYFWAVNSSCYKPLKQRKT